MKVTSVPNITEPPALYNVSGYSIEILEFPEESFEGETVRMPNAIKQDVSIVNNVSV